MLNINNSEELSIYIKEQRQYWKEIEEINRYSSELFRKMMHYFSGIGLLYKDSEERKELDAKIEELDKLKKEEEKRIEPKMDALDRKYAKWFVKDLEISDLRHLGNYISVYLSSNDDTEKQEVQIIIKNLLDNDETLYNRYIQWQGTDDDIKKLI